MRLALAFTAALGVLAASAPGDDIDPSVREVLTKFWHFTADDLAEVQHGRVVRRSLESLAPGELAVVGAIRVNAPKQRFLDLARDIERFKRSPDVLALGRFSAPPVLRDLAPLTIDTNDFDAATCRVHDCDVRL